MNGHRITTEQLLNLADRAEDGGLTAEEARRLRAGITQLVERSQQLETARRAAVGYRGHIVREGQEALRRLTAVRALVESTRHRGGRTVLVPTLAAVLDAPLEFGTRQQEAA